MNGIFEVTTAGSIAWMSHAGGWLECAGGPTGSVRATVRVPGYGPITYGYSGNDSALPLSLIHIYRTTARTVTNLSFGAKRRS